MKRVSDSELEEKIKGILDAREKRVEKQKQWQKECGLTCVVIRCNYPGIDKNNPSSRRVVEELAQEVEGKFKSKIAYKKTVDSSEGLVYVYFVDRDAVSLKKELIRIEEEHRYGRLGDIDVYKKDGTAVSRRELGIDSRKCYICNGDAHLCVRSRNHNLEEIEKYIKVKVWGRENV